MEVFANRAATTLDNGGSVDGTSDPVTFTVTDASTFPATGDFRILIDDEIMKVTGVSSNDFTAARAQEGTSIATHADASDVTHVLTRGSLYQLLADMNLKGAFSSRPSAGLAGRKYYCTDTPFWYYDNGTTWDKFFGSYPIVTVDDSLYSWDNQNSMTKATTKDMVSLTGTNGGGITLRYKSAPSAPYHVEFGILWGLELRESSLIGVAVRESSSGKVISFNGEANSNTYAVSTWKWNNTGSFNAAYVDRAKGPTNPVFPLFMRITDDNTNIIFEHSADLVNWAIFDSHSRTDYLTTPDQIAFLVGGGTNTTYSFIHYREY